ncbi:hypothetical protein [Ornithinimicrobium pekingense]|uniref:ABC transmembrane type-1 domain-containing protein n=1 Tax=Ornithinimicrobium pekingense TaxID=384677 RepID=A0ABQ2F6P3_9MICO|nr:hypothetical protein [Ornithinimicrobium pekingense]GGK67383.1 hypothetical protein GCM10011509_14640 [Ornithinimicrobium pekingense]
MLGHLMTALRRLFPSRWARLEVVGLVLVMAAVPIVEMLVIRLFSDLVIHGPQQLRDGADVTTAVALFLAALAVARLMHHLVRIARVGVFRRRFEQLEATRTASRQSWDWALALELSGVLVSIVQVVAFCVLFLVLDPLVALANVVVVVVVLAVVGRFYSGELHRQQDYVTMGSRPGSTPINDRVGGRIKIAELGALLGSAGMALVLVLVLVRTLGGEIASSDAVVFFLGLRLLYGQVGTYSAGIMRFARAAARTDLVSA